MIVFEISTNTNTENCISNTKYKYFPHPITIICFFNFHSQILLHFTNINISKVLSVSRHLSYTEVF